MTGAVKHTLDSWGATFSAAQEMVRRLRQLGFDEEMLPSRDAIRASCLALQSPGAAVRLRRKLAGHEPALGGQGVLAEGQSVASLNPGALVAIGSIVDKLEIHAARIEDMVERAWSYAAPDCISPDFPVIMVPSEVTGYRHEPVIIEVKLRQVDRLLIYDDDQIKVHYLPAGRLEISTAVMAGNLNLYAENMYGAAAAGIAFRER